MIDNYSLGALNEKIDLRDYIAAFIATSELPDEFSLNNLPKIKNQGSVGSCVAHALASIIEWHNKQEYDKDIKMSTGFIYGNRRTSLHKGSGMYIRDALKAVQKFGDAQNSAFNVNIEVPEAIAKFEENFNILKDDAYHFRIAYYARLLDADNIKRALLTNGPVVFSINTYNDLHVKDGVLLSNRKSKEKRGGHCMFIYGWNEQGWLIQNSWGGIWGNKGRCILPYDYPLKEAWTISDVRSDNVKIKSPFRSKVGSYFAQILNLIINFLKKNYKIGGLIYE